MSSEVPQDKDAVFIAGIDSLIEKVEAIDVNVNPNEDFPVIPEAVTFKDYNNWLDEVEEHFNTDDLKIYLPHDFFFARRLRVPQSYHFGIPKLKSRLPELEPHKFREKLHNAITFQISTLHKIKDEYTKRTKQIVIHIEHDGTIWRDDRDKYFHKSTSGKTKRVLMLKHIASKQSPVGAKELMKKLGYAQVSTLSREKGELNGKLREHLGLHQDVILGGEHTRNSGYMINPAFIVIAELKRS